MTNDSIAPKKTIRIQDVALAAGVSTATVSRTLSDPEKVTKETRESVFEAIRATGYRLNKAARNLRKRQAGAVLVLVPNLGNPFFSQILAGISAGFAQSDVSVLMTDTTVQHESGKSLVDYFLDSRIDGMICLDGGLTLDDLDHLAAHNVGDKIVFACEWVHGSDLPSVRSNNALGAQMAIRHLYDLGHRKIAHITGPQGNVLTRARREGMLSERQRLNLPARDDWIVRGDFSLQSGRDAAQKIAAMSDRPTAVFCASDMVAFGLISGLNGLGLSVPDDISVVGFDDIEMAEFSSPPLTTVRQDRNLLGRRAAQRLLERLKGGQTGSSDLNIDELDVQLSVRQSTAAPPRL